MQVPMLDLKAQFASIKSEVMSAIEEVCESQMLCLGPVVQAFELQAAEYCGCKHAIGVSSGSDALIIALMALNVGPGDEVITTPFTFFATAGAIARVGAKPVFVDVDAKTYNISPTLIEAAITKRTKAIIPVHLFGQMAQMKPIMDLAKEHNLAVIEDAAQSIGAEQNHVPCGGIGDMGCFSFYPTKNLGAFGDGGMVTTNNDDLAQALRILRDHGQHPRYYYQRIGGNFRLDAIQGAVLSVKIKSLDAWSDRRRANAEMYNELLASTPVICPTVESNNLSVYNQYTIRSAHRDQLQAYLGEKQIGSAVFYPKALHVQDCFADLGYCESDFPVTNTLCKEVLSLPIFPELAEQQIRMVAKAIGDWSPA
ncbi:MAG: DegT/DnrJ/EryC1/StrS family aminotransferase [Planctomycetes bacterium]|nr:DegT/DnrJ/EryC1/StrS family aminotransferase [Planctomycetota bacterium]